jgi:hypothetical protein
MSSGQKSVELHVDADGMDGPVLMGTLHAQIARQEIFSFEYAAEWLRRDAAFAFDPDLQLFECRSIRHNLAVTSAFSSTPLLTVGPDFLLNLVALMHYAPL